MAARRVRARTRIEGGEGHDRLWGGLATDSFVFAGGRDRIVDWEPGETLLIGPGLSARREADWLVDRYGRRDGDDLVLDFGQDLLRIEDAGRLGLSSGRSTFSRPPPPSPGMRV